MDIKKVSIVNWQCIDNLTISFEKLMILIGEGNRGKTSIVNGVLAALKYREITECDFKDKNSDISITIRCFDESRGFLSIKFLVKPNLEERYILRYKGQDIELSKEDYLENLKDLRVIKVSAREVNIKETLKSIKNIVELNLEENEKIISDLNSKIEYLEREEISQGLQRKILFSFLKNTLHEFKQSKNIKNNKFYRTILVFEEPELFLNPQASRELYEIFIKLSKIGVQIILETHSSYFVGIKQYKSICLVKKRKDKVVCYQNSNKLFNGDEVKNFNMNYWINPDRGELFFAKKVILVEGQTDKICLSYLAKKIGVYKYNYSIIECGSKSIIPQFIKVLNGFRIPYVAVYDKDNHKWRTEIELESSNLKNRQIRRLVDKHIGEYIEIVNDIEEEIYQEERERKNYKNKPYYALQTISSPEYKVPEGLKKKIEQIYK